MIGDLLCTGAFKSTDGTSCSFSSSKFLLDSSLFVTAVLVGVTFGIPNEKFIFGASSDFPVVTSILLLSTFLLGKANVNVGVSDNTLLFVSDCVFNLVSGVEIISGFLVMVASCTFGSMPNLKELFGVLPKLNFDSGIFFLFLLSFSAPQHTHLSFSFSFRTKQLGHSQVSVF